MLLPLPLRFARRPGVLSVQINISGTPEVLAGVAQGFVVLQASVSGQAGPHTFTLDDNAGGMFQITAGGELQAGALQPVEGFRTVTIRADNGADPALTRDVEITVYKVIANTGTPAVTPSMPEVGVDNLSVSYGTWAGFPAPTFTARWFKKPSGGASFASVTGFLPVTTYNPPGVANGDEFYAEVRAENSREAVTAASNIVTYSELQPPTAAGNLVNQSFQEDTGPQFYNVSGDFSNTTVGTWSLVSPPTGVTINQSGVITFNTDVLAVQAGTAITARYTNAAGFADSGFSLEITAAPSGIVSAVDTFTDTDLTLLTAHDGEITEAWIAAANGSGAMRISSNTLHGGTGGNVCAGIDYVGDLTDTGVEADYISQVGLKRVGIAARMSRTTADAYIAYLDDAGANGTWTLAKLVSGGLTTLGTDATGLASGQTQRVRLECEGTTIRFQTWNGLSFDTLISVTDADHASGIPGVYCTQATTIGSDNSLDNFQFDNLGSGGGGGDAFTLLQDGGGEVVLDTTPTEVGPNLFDFTIRSPAHLAGSYSAVDVEGIAQGPIGIKGPSYSGGTGGGGAAQNGDTITRLPGLIAFARNSAQARGVPFRATTWKPEALGQADVAGDSYGPITNIEFGLSMEDRYKQLLGAPLVQSTVIAAQTASQQQQITFDGNSYLTGNGKLDGASNATANVSGLLRFSGTGNGNRFCGIAGHEIRIHGPSSSLGFRLRQTSETLAYVVDQTGPTNIKDGQDRTLVWSYDGATGAFVAWLKAPGGAWSEEFNLTGATGTCDLGSDSYSVVGAFNNGSNKLVGSLWRLCVWQDVTLDVSDAAVRSSMEDETQADVLGTRIIDFYGPVSHWRAGGQQGTTTETFTEVGTLT